MPDLSIHYTDLLTEVGAFLGYGSDYVTLTANQLAEVDRYVQAGVRQFYYPPAAEGVESGYEWSFLKPSAVLETVAGEGATALPSDFGRLVGDFFFESSLHREPIVQVSEGRLQTLRQKTSNDAPPRLAAIRYIEQEEGESHVQEVLWWPVPNAVYELSYRYEANSGKLSEANPYPLGGMKYSELVLESCLAVAEQRANDERGMHTELFLRMLSSTIAQDRRHGARYFGSMGGLGASTVPRRLMGSSYNVTYKGETW